MAENPEPEITDPMALLRSLDVETIEARLDALNREQSALRVLLRSARARQRAASRRRQEPKRSE
jgi:hypothetical protein